MENPGVYASQAEAWAFIPFLGTLATIGLGIIAVLCWMAGRDRRLAAALVSIAALAIGAASSLGLSSAAASYEQRDLTAARLYAIELQSWAAGEYGVVLNQADAADLANGRTVSATHLGEAADIRLRMVPGGTDVQLVRLDGVPIG